MTPVREEVLKNLIYYRKKNGLTQRELAKALNVGFSTVCGWEHGASSPDIDTLVTACSVLHTTLNDMFGKFAVDAQYNYTQHEIDVINAYRAHPELQAAVDKLLEVDAGPAPADDIGTVITAALKKDTVSK